MSIRVVSSSILNLIYTPTLLILIYLALSGPFSIRKKKKRAQLRFHRKQCERKQLERVVSSPQRPLTVQTRVLELSGNGNRWSSLTLICDRESGYAAQSSISDAFHISLLFCLSLEEYRKVLLDHPHYSSLRRVSRRESDELEKLVA